MKAIKMINLKIKDINDPEVFLAIKRMCQYVVREWEASFLSDEEVEAEYKLATAKTKRHKDDVIKLANIDTDLSWGSVKKKRGEKESISVKEGALNPWYDGDLTLKEFLNSMEGLVEFLSYSDPRYIYETELEHFYTFLRNELSNGARKLPEPPKITIDTLHPKIQKASKSLFRDKHYSQAILEAYKIVFMEIKDISGVRRLSDKPLAEKVFSLNDPIIKLNNLDTDYDEDEQKGFMLIFSGAALGIRNPKAHDIVVQKDPQRTLEYLSFASLLMARLGERIEPTRKKKK